MTPAPTPLLRLQDGAATWEARFEEDLQRESDQAILGWFVVMWIGVCICLCLYNKSNGEEGMDIVPGGAAICKVDDALFDGRLTTRFRYGDVTTMPVSFDQWGSGSGNTPLSQSDNRRIPEKSTKFESYQPVRGTHTDWIEL